VHSNEPLAIDTPPVPRTFAFWRELRSAARGTRHDYTEGPIGQAIFLLAVPMVLEMIMESLFAVSARVGGCRLGAEAVATVGLTERLLIVVYPLARGLGISIAATVARRTGEKNLDGAASSLVQGLALGAMISAVLGIIGAVFAPQLLAMMGATPSVIASGSNFARVMLGGSGTAFLLFNINAGFRGAGDAAVSMRVLWLANAINIVLGPLLIFGPGFLPEMGVTGAAVATTIGRGIGLLYAVNRLVRGTGHLAVRRKHLVPDWALMGRMIKMSGSGTFQVLVGSMSWIGLIRIMASFGSVPMAGYTIAIRLMMFALLPAWGLSNAAATMVGQSLGAKNPDRAAKSVWTAARYNVCFLGLFGLFFLIFAPWIVSAFTSDPAVAEVATFGLRTMAVGFPFFAFGMVLINAFNGAGDTWTPTRINLGVFWLFEIPFAWVMAHYFGVGFRGIFVAVLTAYSLLAVVGAIWFRRGTWKLRHV